LKSSIHLRQIFSKEIAILAGLELGRDTYFIDLFNLKNFLYILSDFLPLNPITLIDG
tara:strand:+ start:67 stop:237 length:171 start_codon:yes stop_codon:yes gene_type:complete